MPQLANHIDLARAAAQAFRHRQQQGRRLVAANRLGIQAATDKLKPWAAIACLCGSDLPELNEGIAGHRTRYITWGTDALDDIGEDAARAQLAEEICPRAQWAPVLEHARDYAPRRTEEEQLAADDLILIARHLEWDPCARRNLRPFGATILPIDVAAQEAA